MGKHQDDYYKRNRAQVLAKRKASYEQNKAYEKERYLKRYYKITQADYDNMLSKQGGKCAVCGIQKCATGKAFAVDHDHSTGKVRGLLCARCNLLLGKAKENIPLLKGAIKYLETV